MSKKIENEVKLVLSNEVQAKLTPNISAEELDSFHSRLIELFEFAGFQVNNEKTVTNSDHYFDTEEGDLNNSQHSFRVRKNAEGLMYTIKKPLGSGVSLQRRVEIEDVINDEKEYENLVNANFSSIIDKHLVDFSGVPIVESAIILNKRRQFEACRSDEKYKVCVDLVKFSLPGSNIESREEVELEIEAESEQANVNIDEIKRRFLGIFPEFTYSHKSKFSRACDFLNPYRVSWLHRVVKIYKDHALLGLLVLLIGLIGSVFSIVGYFK